MRRQKREGEDDGRRDCEQQRERDKKRSRGQVSDRLDEGQGERET